MTNNSVLLVGNFLTGSPASRSPSEDLAERLAAGGWTVLTASSRVSRPARLADMVSTTWRRRDHYAVARVDVFSGASFVWAEAVCWTLRRAGKPYVLTLHGGRLPRFARRWERRVRALLGSAAAVTAPSRFLVDQMQPYRPGLRLVPNGIETSACRFRPRRSLQPSLVWLRAFHRIYHPELAPRVLALLAPEFPGVRLVMAGPDKGDGSLQQMWQTAETLGVARRITVTGGVPKNQVPETLDSGDIFLNTSGIDNTPVSVLEAMACGLCVVSTNVGGIPYLLDHETDALLAPPEDPEALARAVRRLLTEPDLAARLSRQARAKAERFDWSVVLPQWKELFGSLIPSDERNSAASLSPASRPGALAGR